MQADVIVIGAGASGLMAAHELSKAGKKVFLLEARERIGGRIYPLDEKEWGYPAQGGAEFVHGLAPVTKRIAEECGMTLIPTQGDMWDVVDGHLTINGGTLPDQEPLLEKLNELKEDMPFSEFAEKHLSDPKFENLRHQVTRMIENYDAADPARISTIDLRSEWLGNSEWLQYRIKEGYSRLLNCLETGIRQHGGEIKLGQKVSKVAVQGEGVEVSANGQVYKAGRVVVTVPLPLLETIEFDPPVQEKIKAVEKMGFGGVIKILLKFKDRWWVKASGKDFNEMDFLRSDELISIWWTQYPETAPVLVGWIGGPKTEKFKHSSESELIEAAISSLQNIFQVERKLLDESLVKAQAFNWLADSYTRGGYSYATPETLASIQVLSQPVEDKIFFAGEALYSKEDTSTVEGALGSGEEVALRILSLP